MMWAGDLCIKERYSKEDYKKLAHAVWQCKYHLVWCPKYQFRILSGEIGRLVREIIKKLFEWKKVEILAGSARIDHIHLVLSIPPMYSVSELVGFLKGRSAIKVLDRHLDLKRRYAGVGISGLKDTVLVQ